MGQDDHYPSAYKPHKQKPNEIYIATYNVLSLRTPEKLIELETALKNVKWDILGLSEIRRVGNQIEEYDDYILYYIGETKGQYGVGFMVKKQLKDQIIEFKGVSERIATLNIQLKSSRDKWTIIQVYAPTEAAEDTIKDEFYNQLTATLENTHKNLIVMGDFNGKIGRQKHGEESVMGNFGIGKRSKNGERVVNIALENNLTFINSIFKKKPANKWTWISPDGSYRNEIDYIMSNQPKFFQNVNVLNNINFNSNHRMVRATLSCKHQKKQRNHFKTRYAELPPCIQEDLTSNRLNKVQELYTSEIISMYGTKQRATLKEKKSILNPKTKELIQKRQDLLKIKKNKETLRKITQLSKEISRGIKQDRASRRFKTIENYIVKTGGINKALKELREQKTWIQKIKLNNNKSETRRQPILKTATDFYRKLYSTKNETQIKNIDLDDSTEEIPQILESEVQFAIRTQKNEKAPGPDQITNEMIKSTLPETIKRLTNLFNLILTKETVPTQWTTSTIILIHKKGDRFDINNYRPVSLMSNIYKTFSKIILSRIAKKLDEQQPREQGGFRTGYSTIDHIHVIKQLIEKCQEYNHPLYMAFVDYNKAFDSLEHENIWEALKNQGVEKKYIRIIKNVYSNCTARIKLESEGESFAIQRGVRQGDPLSPKLFTAVLEEVFRKMTWDNKGININGTFLNHLRFADDIILLTDNPETLQTMLQDLSQESKKVGLTMNKAKTKIMTTRSHRQITVEGEEIESVDSYVYLGHLIAFGNQMDLEIERRITNSWKRYWSLKEVMKSKQYSTAIKRKLYQTCILPVLTYGCQTWANTRQQQQKLITCQRAMERSILGLTKRDRKRAVDIRNITKIEDVVNKTKKLKWRWTGHFMRENRNKWTKDITEWTPRFQTKRKKGRQRIRWSDDIRKVAGPLWQRMACIREEWKKLEEAFVSQDTPNKYKNVVSL